MLTDRKSLYEALFPHMLVTQLIECDKHFGIFCLIILSRLTKKMSLVDYKFHFCVAPFMFLWEKGDLLFTQSKLVEFNVRYFAVKEMS